MATNSYSPTLVNTLNEIAHKYGDRIDKAIKEIISQPRYVNTGAGVDSLKVTVIEGTASKSPDIIITVADHITLLDKRKLEWTKQPPVAAELEQWGESKTFQFIPGYKNGLAPNLPPWKAKQRVLWAIAKSKQKFDTHKPKPWRKKSLGGVLKEMNALVLLEFEQAIEKDFQQAINKGLHG